jgi:V/A-type H+-transporting ATPase subunit B
VANNDRIRLSAPADAGAVHRSAARPRVRRFGPTSRRSQGRVEADEIPIGTPTVNPVRRRMPDEMVHTGIPMIDIFNSLVESQKLPIFSVAGEPYNELLARVGCRPTPTSSSSAVWGCGTTTT